MRREKYASCDESPLNMSFRYFTMYNKHERYTNRLTARLTKMYFTHSVKICMNIYRN